MTTNPIAAAIRAAELKRAQTLTVGARVGVRPGGPNAGRIGVIAERKGLRALVRFPESRFGVPFATSALLLIVEG